MIQFIVINHIAHLKFSIPIQKTPTITFFLKLKRNLEKIVNLAFSVQFRKIKIEFQKIQLLFSKFNKQFVNF